MDQVRQWWVGAALSDPPALHCRLLEHTKMSLHALVGLSECEVNPYDVDKRQEQPEADTVAIDDLCGRQSVGVVPGNADVSESGDLQSGVEAGPEHREIGRLDHGVSVLGGADVLVLSTHGIEIPAADRVGAADV